MRSKTSYFNPTLFKKNLMRFWPLWGGVSLLGALLPLYLLTGLLQVGIRSHHAQPLEMTLGYYEALHYAVPVISLLYGVLCALAVWSYLYNHRSVSLYHALPVTRKGLFVTNFLSGLAMLLIPYAVTGGLTILVSLLAGIFEPVGVLVTILGVLGFSFFYFSAATLIAFFTGNPFAFAGFYFIFHFLAAAAEWMVTELMSEFYFGVNSFYSGVLDFLSPTLFFLNDRHLDVDVVYQETVTPSGWIDYGQIQSVALRGGWVIAVYALAGAVLLGCAWALYRRRRSESAGDVVAVGWMKPVFRYGVALCVAVTGGTVLYHLFWDGFQSRSTVAPLPMAVCMAAAGLVGYYIASMLLAKSFHVFRGSWRGALASVLAAAAVCAVIALDPAGMESWVPEAGALESVTVSLHDTNGRGVYANITDPAAVQKILSLHSAVLAEEEQLDNRSRNVYEYTGYNGYANVSLRYYDRDGELAAYRDYYLNYPDGLQSEALRQLKDLACDPAVQEANIFSLNRNGAVTTRLTGGYVNNLYNSQTGTFEGLDLTLDQARELEAAIRRDIQAGNFGKTFLMDDYRAYQQTIYDGRLELNYNITEKAEFSNDRDRDWADTTYGDTVSVSISTYCTETLKALEKTGVLDASHRLLTEEECIALQKLDGSYDEDYYGPYDAADLGDGYVEPGDAMVYAETAF